MLLPRAQWAAYGVPDPVPHAAPVSLTGLPPRDPAAPLPAGACRHPGCLAMEMNCLVDTGRCLNCAEPLDADGHDRDACAAELANLGLADDREANP